MMKIFLGGGWEIERLGKNIYSIPSQRTRQLGCFIISNVSFSPDTKDLEEKSSKNLTPEEP